MTKKQLQVTFQPSERVIYVLEGTTIIEAAAQAGLTIHTPCGSAGTCGKCRVNIPVGAGEPSQSEQIAFSPQQLKEGWRLACQCRIQTDTVVKIPENSLLSSQHKIVIQSHTNNSTELYASIRKQYVEIAVPTMEDNTPDLLRLEKAIGPFKTNLQLLRSLPKQLRKYKYTGTAVWADSHLIDFEIGDTSDRCYGVAFDIGTTTIVAALLDLSNANELAVTAQINPQIPFGDDVLSRIKHASSCEGCLEELRHAVISVMNEMLNTLCQQAGINREWIYEVAVTGNTTMEHLLCGIDPSPLGQIPFVPAHAKGLLFNAKDLDIFINHHGKIYVFPIIGGFVGGDTVAGILVTHLPDEKGVSLMIDIGTNGEIALAKNGQIWAASTAAGPAFEGARIRCGMRATTGAIEKIVFNDDIRYSVIGNTPPVGLCGSALIDLIAEMLKAGIITPTGQLLTPEELPPKLPSAIRNRIHRNTADQTEFLVSQAPNARQDLQVLLTQRDIREFQLAVGAIRAGINIMLKKADIKIEEICRVLIAGGFGSFIRRTNAQRIGLLPTGIDHQIINYVGNTALAGAKWALLSSNARRYAEEIARNTKHLELSLETDFQMEFAEAMIFPEFNET